MEHKNKIKRATIFGKSEGIILRVVATILMLAINIVAFSQIKINNVREGFYEIYSADSIKIDSKATEAEALQGLTNYQLLTGNKGYMIPASYRVDITGNTGIIDCPPILTFKIDTIESLVHNYGNITSKNEAVFDNCIQKFIVSKDSTQSIPSYSFLAKMERETSWIEAKTTYKLISIIEMLNDLGTIIESKEAGKIEIHAYINKDHCIGFYLDGVDKGQWKYEEGISNCHGTLIDGKWHTPFYINNVSKGLHKVKIIIYSKELGMQDIEITQNVIVQ